MNVNTGQIKELRDLAEAEKDADFWKRVPFELEDKASQIFENDGFVDLEDNSRLAKFAKKKREEPKGIISKKRFRDIKKATKRKNND